MHFPFLFARNSLALENQSPLSFCRPSHISVLAAIRTYSLLLLCQEETMTTDLDNIGGVWDAIVKEVGDGWHIMSEEEKSTWNHCVSLRNVIVGTDGRSEWINRFVDFGTLTGWCSIGKWRKPSSTLLLAEDCAADFHTIFRNHHKLLASVEKLARSGDRAGKLIASKGTLCAGVSQVDDNTAEFQRLHRQSIAALAQMNINDSVRAIELTQMQQQIQDTLKYGNMFAHGGPGPTAAGYKTEGQYDDDDEEPDDEEPEADEPPDEWGNDPFRGEMAGVVMTGLQENAATGKLIPKRKLRQLKLRQAFVKKNFQRYPLEKCIWEANLGKHVYPRPQYSKEFGPEVLGSSRCCGSCYLKPCLMVGKKAVFQESFQSDHGDKIFEIKNASILAHNLMGKYVGKQYMRRFKLTPFDLFLERTMPQCIRDGLSDIQEQVWNEKAHEKRKE